MTPVILLAADGEGEDAAYSSALQATNNFGYSAMGMIRITFCAAVSLRVGDETAR
jgi:hypothetical protein